MAPRNLIKKHLLNSQRQTNRFFRKDLESML